MQIQFNEHLPWSQRLETGPAECAERLNNDKMIDNNEIHNMTNTNNNLNPLLPIF